MSGLAVVGHDQRTKLFTHIAKAVMPGLLGRVPPQHATTTIPLQALVSWAPSAPISGLPGDRILPSRSSVRRTLADLIPSMPAMTAFYVPKITFPAPPAAVPHAVASDKAQAALTFARELETLQSIATWISITDEVLDDPASLAAWLELLLAYLVKVGEEYQLLNGDGVSPNLRGFMTRTDIPVYAGTATTVERLAGMIAQAASSASGFAPDTVVVSPGDWGQLAAAAMLDDTGARAFGLDLVVSPALADGESLVGPCQTASVIGRSGDIRVEGTQSHASEFAENISAIRAASRLALGVLVPSAFVKSAA